jgi:hypothetical protein
MRCFIVMAKVNVWNDRRMLNVILCRWFLVRRAVGVRNRSPRDRLLQPMTDCSKIGRPWSPRTTTPIQVQLVSSFVTTSDSSP